MQKKVTMKKYQQDKKMFGALLIASLAGNAINAALEMKHTKEQKEQNKLTESRLTVCETKVLGLLKEAGEAKHERKKIKNNIKAFYRKK